MEPASSHPPDPLAAAARLGCYEPWLKVAVALRYALTYPWAPDAWHEVREHLSWLLAERDRLRRAGWFS